MPGAGRRARGDVDARGRWGGSGLEPGKDRGTQMGLEALGTRVLLLRWPQTGRGGVRTGEGMGRGPRIQGRTAFFLLVLGSAGPAGLQTLVWEPSVGLKGWGESRVQVSEPRVSMNGPAASTSVSGE